MLFFIVLSSPLICVVLPMLQREEKPVMIIGIDVASNAGYFKKERQNNKK